MKLHWKIVILSIIALAAIAIFVQIKYKPFTSHTTITHFSASSDDSLADYYQTAQQMASQNAQTSTTTATFLAVGDINLSRSVASEIIKQNNVDYPFLGMADVLKSTDFNFANLESPIAPAGKQVIGGNSLIFGAPAANAQALKDYNFQIVNSANNHAFDQGLAGIDITSSTLDGLGIKHEGTGDNLDQAWKPAAVEVNGIKICFVGASFSSLNDGGKVTNTYVARIEDTARLKSAIDTAKAECDFVVATMHAGIEYTKVPNSAQTTFAHNAIDDGADMVIGAHPHWVQPIEKYKNKYIFYSLGNFIFDQSWSQDTSEGLTLKITISKNQQLNPTTPGAASLDDLQGNRQDAQLESVELLPVIIKNSVPFLATELETKNILTKIGQTESILK